jgi:paraquat-inducible protein A
MFAVVVTFDPRVLWDLADELGDRSQRPLPRTSADSAAAAVNSQAGPPAPADLQAAMPAGEPTAPQPKGPTTQASLPPGVPPAPHQG